MRKRFFIALALSLFLIHLPLLFLVMKLDEWDFLRPIKQVQPKAVFVTLPPPRQLVDQPKPKASVKPKQARAESLHDVSVKEETVAAQPQKSAPVPPKPQAPVTPPKPLLPPPSNTQKPDPQPQPVQKNPISLKDALASVQSEKKAQEKQELKKFEPVRQTPVQDFKSGFYSAGGDYLPDYKVGNRTYVNALANPEIQYFIELKRKFQMTWNPRDVLRNDATLRKKGKIVTVLGVSVDADGGLKQVVLIQSSGNQPFDAEAYRTVRDSSPFSRPPVFLLKEEGLVNMAWTFVVYL